MKNNICGIIGLCLIGFSAILGFISNVSAVTVVSISVAFLGATMLVINALKKAKEEGNYGWQVYVVVICSAIGGCLCAVGGLTEEIITTVVGAVITLATVIFSIITGKKKDKKEV